MVRRRQREVTVASGGRQLLQSVLGRVPRTVRLMQRDPEIVRKVRELVARKTGLPEERISPEARLLHDLGVEGDDAEELLVEFCDEFRVDITDIKVSKYFSDESSVASSLWFLRSSIEARLREKEPLTVDQLVIAAQLRKWTH